MNNVLACSVCSAFYAGLTGFVVLSMREVALGDHNKTAVETQLHDYQDEMYLSLCRSARESRVDCSVRRVEDCLLWGT